MALMPVAEALRRVLDGARRCRAKTRRSPKRTGACSPPIWPHCARSRPMMSPPWTAMLRARPMLRACRRSCRLVGEVAAGHPFERPASASAKPLASSPAASYPPGSDTIVIQENTERDGDTVVVTRHLQPGKHVRVGGLDFAQRRHAAAEGPPTLCARRDAGGRHEPPDRAGAPQTQGRRARDRRRTGAARCATPGPGEIVYSNGFALMALARRKAPR